MRVFSNSISQVSPNTFSNLLAILCRVGITFRNQKSPVPSHYSLSGISTYKYRYSCYHSYVGVIWFLLVQRYEKNLIYKNFKSTFCTFLVKVVCEMSKIQARSIIKHPFCCILVSICIVFWSYSFRQKWGGHKESNEIFVRFFVHFCPRKNSNDLIVISSLSLFLTSLFGQ